MSDIAQSFIELRQLFMGKLHGSAHGVCDCLYSINGLFKGIEHEQ